jgi:tetratricopeptide (TPR) repeat protein
MTSAQVSEPIAALRAKAAALRASGDRTGAETAELEAIAAGIERPEFRAAEAALEEGSFEQAEVLLRAHLRSDPLDPAGALMLGQIAAKCGAAREAANLFMRAIKLAPAYLEAHLALAKHHRDHGEYDAALAAAQTILARQPDHLPALSLRASLFEQLRRFEEADAAFEELHRRHPGDARGWANHAFMLKTVGRQTDAIDAYRKALALDPGHGHAWWGLSNLKTFRFDADDIAAMRQALAVDDLSGEERTHLWFALGKALDDADQPEQAFAAYSEGAEIRLRAHPYDPQKVQDHVSKSQRICTSTFFAARKGWGSQKPDPIFIVSLPRSGSTLIEQILASHPAVEGTEELADVERIALSLGPKGGTGAWLDALERMNPADLAQLGDHYVEATRRFRHTDRPRFTDKMPSNWVYTGLIHAMLPRAKIVSVRRHPLGCGFANFSQHFNWGINFSYDLEHIGGFYRAFVRQMAHFDAALPGRVHHVIYEDLVQNTEGEVRRLLDYLELPFDEGCLRFFETSRPVYTPSSEQVRSPINNEGMERWKRYDAWLGPLKQALGEVLEHYPQVPPDPASA